MHIQKLPRKIRMNKSSPFLRLIAVLLIAFVPEAFAVVQEPDPVGTTVQEAFDFVVGSNAVDNIRFIIKGLTLGVAFCIIAYAIHDSFGAFTDGQITKKAWGLLVIRALGMLTILNILISL